MAGVFSVAMCTYDGARFVAEQLTSLAAQTRPPFELVVCDDRSTDGTPAIVAEFAASAPFPVRLHVNERNLGSTKNFERALGLCAGELIALCDQDDVWRPEKLERLGEEFARAPEVGLVFSDAELIDEDSRPTGERLWDRLGFRREERERLARGRASRELLTGSTVTGATMAFRARFRELVLPIPEDLALIHDGWIALAVSTVARVSPLSEPLVKYRRHAAQQVGPLGRKDAGASHTGVGAARAAMRRANPYAETLAVAESLRQRLLDKREEFDSREAVAELEGRIEHLRARARLPESKLRRAGCVLRELATRRYHLYSNGVRSAVKDLLV